MLTSFKMALHSLPFLCDIFITSSHPTYPLKGLQFLFLQYILHDSFAILQSTVISLTFFASMIILLHALDN